MSTMQSALVAQFGAPHGALGALAGWLMAIRPSNRQRNTWTVAQLLPRNGGRILEIGCGPGFAVETCLKTYPHCAVTAVDHSATMIAQARRRNAGAVANGRAEFLLGSLELASGRTYAAAFSCNVLQFIPDKRAAVAAIAALLEPNAVLASTFQPRNRHPTREQALRWGDAIAAHYHEAGLAGIEVRELVMKPASAVCVVGRRAG